MNQIVEALIQIAGGRWLRFRDPVHVVETRRADDVADVLAEVERQAVTRGLYAVGFVSFEAAAAFALTVRRHSSADALPLAWFAFFEPPRVEVLAAVPWDHEPYELGPLTASVDRQVFDAAFDRIKKHLADGDTYQVNYTFRMEGAFSGHAPSLFSDLAAAQGGKHCAFIGLGSHSICSASPELFFSRSGRSLAARPMKGTSARGRTAAEDRSLRDGLRSSAKQRAENVMIVDMVRNDLGRVAEVGSIDVPELFAVERYPNVWQMTSLITARSAASLSELFAALHPSASVTGAPKVRTMEILSELEVQPRGIYTGAIGYVAPGGDLSFNVAIRTAVVDHQAHTLEFGIGSGIVWDSVAADEYAECLLKGSVLGRRPVQFDLLETMAWTEREGFLLLERHLRRMSDSADYFDFRYDEAEARESLRSLVTVLESAGKERGWRVRVLLSRSGALRLEHRPFEPSQGVLRVGLADTPVDAADHFLFHKTTNRSVYERARSGAREACDEVILWNGSREVTEATTANLVVDLEGALITPPIECGLLPGTFRAEVLGRGEAREGVVTIADLHLARKIWLINSVHGWREARLVNE